MTNGAEWAGSVGDIWAQEWRRTDRSFAELAPRLQSAILAAAPDRPFRALDIGCGAGATSLALAGVRPDATIIGVDLSADLIAVARERAGDLGVGADGSRVLFTRGDAALVAEREGPFDLLYSRHGVMFFDDPVAVFAALRRATHTRGTLIFSCFSDWSKNAFASAIADAIDAPPPTAGAPGPFAFADRDRTAAILRAAGWERLDAKEIPFAYVAGVAGECDAEADALAFLTRIGPAARAIREGTIETREKIIARISNVIAAYRKGDRIKFPAFAWIWTAS